jgi:type I site-specific restriction-modification system R (restriction) subunit
LPLVFIELKNSNVKLQNALAENMRAGLSNANYLAFTGTPLLGKDRKTHTWFG